jgi:hypothetical protein
MDYTFVLRELQSATLFDLHRLRMAIDNETDRPERIAQVRARLKPGQTVDYFDAHANGLAKATVVGLNRTRLVVENLHDKKRWSIPFCAVNVDDVDVDIEASTTQQPLDRNQLSVGDMVGFHDKQNREQYGRILALNQKTASILTNQGQRWRVAYIFLFRVVDTEAGRPADASKYKVLDLFLEEEEEEVKNEEDTPNFSQSVPPPRAATAWQPTASQSVTAQSASAQRPTSQSYSGQPSAAQRSASQPASGPMGAQQPASSRSGAPAVPASGPKIGVNEPCPCGSGKKYKKCCKR